MLEGFKPISLSVGLPYISITTNGLTFNKTSIVKIGKPTHVVLLMNESKKQIAIMPCSENDENATPFLRRGKGNITVRWNNRDLLYTLSKMMQWDLSKMGYRVDGEYISDNNALVFDLNNAVVVEQPA